MTKRSGLDSLADRATTKMHICRSSGLFFTLLNPLALVRYLSLIDVMRKILLNQVSRYSDQGETMKTIIATITLTIAATTLAAAGQYNSQSARQDREYKSLSAATQRAYGTSSTSNSTYKPPSSTNGKRY